jgi:hypothetical protein
LPIGRWNCVVRLGFAFTVGNTGTTGVAFAGAGSGGAGVVLPSSARPASGFTSAITASATTTHSMEKRARV